MSDSSEDDSDPMDDWDDEDAAAADEQQQQQLLAATTLVAGALMGRNARIRKRFTSRFYLRRGQLLPDPRQDTPWQRLHVTRDDSAYIVTMGLDVETFNFVLTAGFSREWDARPLPRSDVHSTGRPRPGGRSLDAAGALGLVLHWLSSCMLEVSLQQIFALTPTVVNRYLNHARDILLAVLQTIAEAAISWPRGNDFEENSQIIQQRHALLVGAFGCMDGLNLVVQTSDDPTIENATFNGWLQGHYCSSVIAFSPFGVIISAVINAPGSWHDAAIARPIFAQLLNDTPDGYYLVTDTAFPRGPRSIDGKIKAPIKQGTSLPRNRQEREELLRFNKQLLSYRQAAEWGMRTLQGSFGRLRVPLDIENKERRGALIETCLRLFNLRARKVGIGQIRNVYIPAWKAGDDELWDGFEDIMFGEIRRRDRVKRFHIVESYE